MLALALTLIIAKAPVVPKPPADLKNPCAEHQLPFKGHCVSASEVTKYSQEVDRWKKSCSAKDRTACVPLGEAYRDGVLVPASPEYAVQLFQFACDGKVALGCATLGSVYRKGLGVGEDRKKGAELTLKACELGHALSCSNAGYFYERGDGVTPDAKKALALYEKACGMKDQQGCENAAVLRYGQSSLK